MPEQGDSFWQKQGDIMEKVPAHKSCSHSFLPLLGSEANSEFTKGREESELLHNHLDTSTSQLQHGRRLTPGIAMRLHHPANKIQTPFPTFAFITTERWLLTPRQPRHPQEVTAGPGREIFPLPLPRSDRCSPWLQLWGSSPSRPPPAPQNQPCSWDRR